MQNSVHARAWRHRQVLLTSFSRRASAVSSASSCAFTLACALLVVARPLDPPMRSVRLVAPPKRFVLARGEGRWRSDAGAGSESGVSDAACDRGNDGARGDAGARPTSTARASALRGGGGRSPSGRGGGGRARRPLRVHRGRRGALIATRSRAATLIATRDIDLQGRPPRHTHAQFPRHACFRRELQRD